jgi:hypothetical protein
MTRLGNTFEGGSDGVAISPANSGGASGNALNAVSTLGASSVVYDNAQSAEGGMSALMNAASGEFAYIEWEASWQSETEVWYRMYFRFDNVSLTNHTAILAAISAEGVVCEVQLRNNNVLGIRDSALTLRFSSSTSIAADTWYRLEWHVVHSTTVGHFEARLFHGANLHGTTPDETFGNLTNNYNTGASSDEVRAGLNSNPGASGATMWVDALAIDDTAWIGPEVVSATYPAAPTNLVANAVSPTQIDLSWDALSGAGGYDIERDGVIVVADHGSTSYSDTGRSPATEYDYRVRGVL